MSEECGPMQPTDAHRHLDPFAGTFRAEVRMWMGPGDPHVMTGRMENTWDLGGRFLKQDYVGDDTEGPFPSFEGRGYWGYNTATSQYEGMWIDNASTMLQVEQGDVDDTGKVWTMTGTLAGPGGKPMTKRSVITLVDDDHHTMEMYFDMGGGETKTMEIQYVRV